VTRQSLRFRLLRAAALSIGLALLAAWLGLTALFERHVERRVEATLDNTLGLILGHVETDADGRIRFDLPLADPRFQTPLSGLYWQLQDEVRPTLLRSRSLWDAVLELPEDRLAAGALHRHRLAGPAGQSLLVLERTVRYRAGGEDRRLRVAVGLDRREISAARADFAAEVLPYLLVLGAVLVLAAWLQVRVGLAPLDAVRQGVRAIRSGEVRRLPADYPDEVLPLAEEVNTLLDAQEQAIERARAWTADLAHGLKTLLVVLAADAERLRGAGHPELADDLDGLAQTLRRRVDRELIRARVRARTGALTGAAPGAIESAPWVEPGADLGAILGRVIRALEHSPDGSRRDWDLECPPSLTVPMPAEDLTELLGNCLENAAQWAVSRVLIRAGRDVGVWLRIEDDGPGVAEDQLALLGQRGRRLDERTPGHGLGLAIAQDICDAYGCTLGFSRAAAGGLAVSLRWSRLRGRG
jgi:signal transduction histidine kinase